MLEIMSAVGIIAIIVSMGCVSYLVLGKQLKMEQSVYQLIYGLNLARSSALQYNSFVTICPYEGGVKCTDDWNSGYVVFRDLHKNAELLYQNQIIRIFPRIDSTIKITWKNFLGDDFLQFTNLGFTNNQNGRFNFYSQEKKTNILVKSVIINKSGRFYVKKSRENLL